MFKFKPGYTPSSDLEPATKKYVDDSSISLGNLSVNIQTSNFSKSVYYFNGADYCVFNQTYGTNSTTSIAVYKSTNLGVTWELLGDVIDEPDFIAITSSTIAVDSNGNVGLLILGIKTPETTATNLYFKFFDGTSWGALETVCNESASTMTETPPIRVSSTGKFYVGFARVSSASTTSAMLHFNSRTDGPSGTWSGVVDIGAINTAVKNAHIVVYSDTVQGIVFSDNTGTIKFASNLGGSWNILTTAYNVSAIKDVIVNDLGDYTLYILSDATENIYTLTTGGVWGTITTTGILTVFRQIALVFTGGILNIIGISQSYYTGSTSHFIAQKYSGGVWGPAKRIYPDFSSSYALMSTYPKCLTTARLFTGNPTTGIANVKNIDNIF